MKKSLALAISALSMLTSYTAHAETSDGKTVGVSVGWMHIMPQGKKQGVSATATNTTVAGLLGSSVNSPNAGFEIQDADTAAILLDYYVNDNVSLEFVGGVPPKMKIDGKGTILENKGGVSLESIGELGKVDAYTPVLLGKYQFGTIESKFRPFFGAGMMYAHFSNFKLDDTVNTKLTAGFSSALISSYGSVYGAAYSSALGSLSIENVKIKDAIAPVVVLGADYNFDKNWFATTSVSYAHLSTNASLDVRSSTLGKILSGESKIEINPVVTYLGLGYRF